MSVTGLPLPARARSLSQSAQVVHHVPVDGHETLQAPVDGNRIHIDRWFNYSRIPVST